MVSECIVLVSIVFELVIRVVISLEMKIVKFVFSVRKIVLSELVWLDMWVFYYGIGLYSVVVV